LPAHVLTGAPAKGQDERGPLGARRRGGFLRHGLPGRTHERVYCQTVHEQRSAYRMKLPGAGDGAMVWTLLRIWSGIGLQSFGGGASTQLLIRRAFVEKRNWIGAEEFGHLWNLCLFTPGINLIALTVLIGRKLAGTRGIAVSLAGLLLPSAMVTCALAAGFEMVRHSPAIHALLRGVVPATAGIMAMVALNFALPLIRRRPGDPAHAPVINVAAILIGALALVVVKIPVAALVVTSAVLGAAIFTPWRRRLDGSPDPTPEQAVTAPDHLGADTGK
jgi:chromate transporter